MALRAYVFVFEGVDVGGIGYAFIIAQNYEQAVEQLPERAKTNHRCEVNGVTLTKSKVIYLDNGEH